MGDYYRPSYPNTTGKRQDHDSLRDDRYKVSKGHRRSHSSSQYDRYKRRSYKQLDFRDTDSSRSQSHLSMSQSSSSLSLAPDSDLSYGTKLADDTNVSPRSTTQHIESSIREQPSMSSLHRDYAQIVKAYIRSTRQRIKYTLYQDHISKGEPVFHKLFTEVETVSMAMIRTLAQGIPARSFATLRSALERSYSPHVSEPIRAAIIGDIGQGKSYLVGTLLGDMDVVKEVSNVPLTPHSYI
jgi:hypothetical protein